MKPYIKEHSHGTPKFTPSLGRGIGISKLGKLVTKNANRSLKKGVRQEIKNQLKNY